ncbi:tol-pal system protein YbgF [Paracoccus pacificus]|uniref:Cell division coordinator CpoB n=1 Tax=Paracoccus pacificus TaxID=1463598 RepID=A0ABW4R2D4_9RHOB
MRRVILAALLAGGLAMPAAAQDAATLADLRAQLSELTRQLEGLRRELVASGAQGFAAAGGDSAIARMDAMEAQLSQLTNQTEEMQNRINRVVKDGTNRIGDIEFRLCEMEEGCDIGALTDTPALGSGGGGAASPLPGNNQGGALTAPAPTPASPAGTATTQGEQAAFDRAREVLGQGDFRGAAELFAAVAETYANGPLTAEARFLEGQALDSAGDSRGAARAWLETFAGAPDGTRAPEALLGLARVMADLGHAEESCLYLQEITTRFPQNPAGTEATNRLGAQNCDLTGGDGVPEDLSPGND